MEVEDKPEIVYYEEEQEEIIYDLPFFVIKRISNKGLVDIDFSEGFFIVSNLTLFNETVLELEIVKGDESSDESKLNFTWSVI